MPSRCLSTEQTARFYRIWFVLLHYVNERCHLVAPFPDIPGPGSVQPEDAMRIRDALWADDTLRERFMADNPARFSQADLAQVASWQHRLAGSFFITRALNAYTIFLTDHTPVHAYGVMGLTSPIEETIEWPLPVIAQAVLLPFEGHIIYDSLLTSYTVFLGPNIRRRLNDDYRNAKEREGIITSLVPASAGSLEEQRTQIEGRNAKVLDTFRKHLLKAGLSLKMVEQHAGIIQTFAYTTLAQHIPPLGLLETTPAMVQAYLQTPGAKTAVTSFKRFIRFLEGTGRMEYEQAEALRQVLKQAHT